MHHRFPLAGFRDHRQQQQRAIVVTTAAVAMPGVAVQWSRPAVLGLYRAILREGRRLQYTDRDFFVSSVRREFQKHRDVRSTATREQLLKKGWNFLNSKLGGLM
ncbi:mitochondrial ribosome and complex I assembly factor AltMIEF1 [Petromyzon marinus]|uniref:mitochondrial ribosome and complex I assembly factor AltMIEF1 n=1 Tax=Petromyzon marinus TaxID=7757 RepID=UPI003F70D3EA